MRITKEVLEKQEVPDKYICDGCGAEFAADNWKSVISYIRISLRDRRAYDTDICDACVRRLYAEFKWLFKNEDMETYD